MQKRWVYKTILSFLTMLSVGSNAFGCQLDKSIFWKASVRKAKEIYTEQINRMTNSQFDVAGHPVFFCQDPESILWEKSIVTKNRNGMVRVDVPVISRDVHMMMVPYNDGQSLYQTVCLHNITISIDTDSGKQVFSITI